MRNFDLLWNPPDRDPRQTRNARVKVIGSALILLAIVIFVVLRLLG